MKKALSTPVQLWHVLLVTVLVATLTSTAVVSAAPLEGMLTQGTMRMAVASADDSMSIDVPNTYTSVSILQTNITVPAGKKADLAVMGEVDMEGGGASSYQYCFGQIRLDNITSGAQFKPGNYILEGFNPPANNLSVPINGYLLNVKAGTHTVYMVLQAGYNDCVALDRSMIVLMNIH